MMNWTSQLLRWKMTISGLGEGVSNCLYHFISILNHVGCVIQFWHHIKHILSYLKLREGTPKQTGHSIKILKSYTKIFFHIILLFVISKKLYTTSTSTLRYLLAITQWRPAIICGVCSREKYWASSRSIQSRWREVQETATSSFPINVVIWFYRIFPVSFFSPCSRVTIEAIYSIDSHVEVCSVTHISFVCNSISIKSSYNYEARVDT